MGEMLVGALKGNLNVVIVRPTIVTSTFQEPFPGWVEGVRTIDSLAVGYGKGRLTCFLGDLNGVVDVIPADMVVNAILVAIVAHANRLKLDGEEVEAIYHVGSSVRHPLRYTNLQDYGFNYFTNKPWIGKDGKPVIVGKVKVLGSMASFRRYMAFRYLLLLKGLEVANTAFCRYFDGMYRDLNRKINFVMRLVELYRPYLFFQGVFDDINTEKLRLAANENIGVENDLFYFDPKSIDWEDYFTNIHIPGVVKYVFK
ncbi:Fatty acyl-CoA reductase 3 [Euphorbia peplus]|nr:Fatty acyl-CoA reductase 3 [Euphorbia peplus]